MRVMGCSGSGQNTSSAHQRLGYPHRRSSQSHVYQNRRASALNGVRYAHQVIMHAHQSSAHARGRQCVRWRLGVCWSGMGAHMNALRLGRRGSKRWSHNASLLMHLPRVGYGRGRGERSASRWPVLKTGSEWVGDQGRVQTAQNHTSRCRATATTNPSGRGVLSFDLRPAGGWIWSVMPSEMRTDRDYEW